MTDHEQIAAALLKLRYPAVNPQYRVPVLDKWAADVLALHIARALEAAIQATWDPEYQISPDAEHRGRAAFVAGLRGDHE